MSYSDRLLEYKKEFKSTGDLVSDTDQIFSEKYFSGGKSSKKFTPPFIPGEIYSFTYNTDTKLSESRKFINRNPVVLCVDSFALKDRGLILKGIDLVVVPPEQRMLILSKVYDTFSLIIEKNQLHYTKGSNLTPVPLTDKNLKGLLKGTGYEQAVTGFKTQFMKEMSVLDLADWYKLPYLRKSLIEGIDLKEIYTEYQSKLI
jgi:hypothetical protein